MVMIKRVLALLGSGALAILLLRQAETAAQAVRDGVQLCLTSVIPALFPFFAVSSLLVALGAAGYYFYLEIKVFFQNLF